MEPVSNLGKFGRILLILFGIALIVLGTAITVDQKTPENAVECTATITSFKLSDEPTVSNVKYTDTYVSYTFNGHLYDNIELGQYETSWEIGDKITVYCVSDNPTQIKTKTMTYGGWIIILLSLPFIIIGIYMLANVRIRASKTPEEIAEDEERTTAGKLKYKVSSIIIPLAAGIPVFAIGIVLNFLEHNPALSWLCFFLGGGATIVGLRSIVLYFIIKYRHYKDDHKNKSEQSET